MNLLDMSGFVDDVFKSVTATRTYEATGSYTDGIWTPGAESTKDYAVNLQPLSSKDIKFLNEGGERIEDSRKVYVNDDVADISNGDRWAFAGVDGEFRAIGIDNRPWRNYCRFYAVRLDV
jgi:hypothetical protein